MLAPHLKKKKMKKMKKMKKPQLGLIHLNPCSNLRRCHCRRRHRCQSLQILPDLLTLLLHLLQQQIDRLMVQ